MRPLIGIALCIALCDVGFGCSNNVDRNHEQKINNLVLLLRDSDEIKQQNAAFAIREFGLIAVPPLAKLLESQDPETRKNAMAAISELRSLYGGWPSTLRTGLSHSDERIRVFTATRLLSCDMEAALAAHAALLESLQSNAQGTRKCGCELIGTVWKEVGDLRPTLDISAADDNNIVRHYVSNAIKVLNREQPVAVAALIDALGDSSKCVRCAAANALRKVGAGARDALPALTKCLDDKECIVSYNAAVALVEIDPEAGQEARPLLESFLKEGKYDSARVEACLKTLREAQATAP